MKIEAKPDDDITVYVSAIDHPFVKNSGCASIAISCYNHGKANQGEIGFSVSEDSERVRQKMVSNRYFFDGSSLSFIGDKKSQPFIPIIGSNGNVTAGMFTQKKGQLSEPYHYFEVEDEFRLQLYEIFDLRSITVPLHKNGVLAAKIGQLHCEYGLEFQFWPFLTPYESVCYLYGEDRADLNHQAEIFCSMNQLPFKQIEAEYFPIY